MTYVPAWTLYACGALAFIFGAFLGRISAALSRDECPFCDDDQKF